MFNIRVYGIWINDADEVLLCREVYKNIEMLKFPGGGLDFGEGMLDCLKREWKEEAGLDIEIIRHYYTTDFFQVSAFNPQQQIISVYYLVSALSQPKMTGDKYVQQFIWRPLSELTPEQITFPIDKHVVSLLTHP